MKMSLLYVILYSQFSGVFFFKMKHTLCYRDTVKANLTYLILLTSIIEKSHLCHAEIIYLITDTVSNVLWISEENYWLDPQSMLISKVFHNTISLSDCVYVDWLLLGKTV